MAELFEPPVSPSTDTSKSVQVRVLKAKFGDGYTQRARDGLNSVEKKFTVRWGVLEVSNADEIESFLERQEGYKAFLWQAPRDDAATLWTCEKWSRKSLSSGLDTITATFERVFDV